MSTISEDILNGLLDQAPLEVHAAIMECQPRLFSGTNLFWRNYLLLQEFKRLCAVGDLRGQEKLLVMVFLHNQLLTRAPDRLTQHLLRSWITYLEEYHHRYIPPIHRLLAMALIIVLDSEHSERLRDEFMTLIDHVCFRNQKRHFGKAVLYVIALAKNDTYFAQESKSDFNIDILLNPRETTIGSVSEAMLIISVFAETEEARKQLQRAYKVSPYQSNKRVIANHYYLQLAFLKILPNSQCMWLRDKGKVLNFVKSFSVELAMQGANLYASLIDLLAVLCQRVDPLVIAYCEGKLQHDGSKLFALRRAKGLSEARSQDERSVWMVTHMPNLAPREAFLRADFQDNYLDTLMWAMLSKLESPHVIEHIARELLNCLEQASLERFGNVFPLVCVALSRAPLGKSHDESCTRLIRIWLRKNAALNPDYHRVVYFPRQTQEVIKTHLNGVYVLFQKNKPPSRSTPQLLLTLTHALEGEENIKYWLNQFLSLGVQYELRHWEKLKKNLRLCVLLHCCVMLLAKIKTHRLISLWLDEFYVFVANRPTDFFALYLARKLLHRVDGETAERWMELLLTKIAELNSDASGETYNLLIQSIRILLPLIAREEKLNSYHARLTTHLQSEFKREMPASIDAAVTLFRDLPDSCVAELAGVSADRIAFPEMFTVTNPLMLPVPT